MASARRAWAGEEPAAASSSRWSERRRPPRSGGSLDPEGTGDAMGMHRAHHPRTSHAASVLGAGATAPTLASLLAISRTAVLPAASAERPSSAHQGRAATSTLDFPLLAGPLQIPDIGVVAPGFDAWAPAGSATSVFSAPAKPRSPLPPNVLHSVATVESAPPVLPALPVTPPDVPAPATSNPPAPDVAPAAIRRPHPPACRPDLRVRHELRVPARSRRVAARLPRPPAPPRSRRRSRRPP